MQAGHISGLQKRSLAFQQPRLVLVAQRLDWQDWPVLRRRY
jgi:hypothetical protein